MVVRFQELFDKSISNIIREMANDELNNCENISDENFFFQPANDRLYKALRMDMAEQERLHRKDDVEAKHKLKLGAFFAKHKRVRPSELNVAINCFSKAILIAQEGSILLDAYYHRAIAFLDKGLYYNSFYDSNYYLENIHDDQKDIETLKGITQCYIESCIRIIESNINKVYSFGKSDNRKNRWIKIASEFLDRARVEVAIQMLMGFEDGTTNLSKIYKLETEIATQALSSMKKFQYYSYKHSNVYDMLDNENRFKGESQARGHDILYEKPLSFLTTKAVRYCGWCSNWIGYKFVPCSGCDEIIFCNWYCLKLAEEFGGHLKVCRYHFRVAQILGVECYLIFIDSSKTRKINYKFKFNSEQQKKLIKNGYIENLIRLKALALTFIIQQKIFKGTLNLNVRYFQDVLNDLRNHYMLPFLKQRLVERFVRKANPSGNLIDGRGIYVKKFDIFGHGLIEYILNSSTTVGGGNIYRYFKSGKIVYKSLLNFIRNKTEVILQL